MVLTRSGMRLLLALVFTALLAGCGKSSLPVSAPSGAEEPVFSGLPRLNALPTVHKAPSISGPGWFSVPPQATDAVDNGTPEASGALLLDSTTGLAYAVYGVPGFDGDNFPTSLKVTLGASSGQFYAGFSDYVEGSWRFAGPFSGTSEADIPGLDEYTAHSAFISPAGVHYFVIVATAGAQIRLAALELGVHGGSLGPRPPRILNLRGGDAGCVLIWVESPDSRMPDFSGYLVERAPLLGGIYALLTADPVTDTAYFDPTAVAGTNYRWRLFAVDTSGNRSTPVSFEGGGVPGINLPPVVRYKLPYGKQYGPANVKVDLTGTFDPEGDPITEYDIEGGTGLPPTSSLTPEFNLVLQPGCYNLVVVAKSGLSTGFALAQLKVYPAWRSSPVVVREPNKNVAGYAGRLGYGKLARNPLDGRKTFFGWDLSARALGIRQEVTTGSYGYATLPTYGNMMYIGEPLLLNGAYYLPLATYAAINLAYWDPAANGGQGAGQMRLIYPGDSYGFKTPDYYPTAVAQDSGGHPWIFYGYLDGGIAKLVAQRVDGTEGEVEIRNNILALNALDALYNPTAHQIDIVLTDTGSLEWLRWDPATNSITDTALIDLGGASFADLELNAATGRPELMYQQPFPVTWHNYTELDGLGSWTPPVVIDGGGVEYPAADLVYNSGVTYAGFSSGAGQFKLYTVTAAGGTVRNTPPDLASAGDAVSLAGQGGGNVLAMYNDGTGGTWLKRLSDGDVNQQVLTIDSSEGQGYQIHAAIATDGLHVIWANFNNTLVHHLISPDGGLSWNPQTDGVAPGVRGFRIASNAQQEMYLSYADAMHRLYRWDPGTSSFVNCGEDSPGTNDHLPVLGGSPLADHIFWIHYDDTSAPPNNIYVTDGDIADGFSSYNFTSDLMPTWDGALQPSPGMLITVPFYGLLAGGGITPSGAYVALYESDSNTWLFPTQGNAPLDLTSNPDVITNAYAGATMAVPNFFGYGYVFWATHGREMAPVRVVDGGGPQTQTDLPLPPASFSTFWDRDLRRTVSADTANGTTPVMIEASLDAFEHYMEWSDFNYWEELPVPDQLSYGVRPTLVVGADGRWHILYVDRVSDRVMCLSTQ